MRTKESDARPERNRGRCVGTAALRDLERQFREAHQSGADLHLLHYLDGRNSIRGTGSGRFRLLAACGAKASGYSLSEGGCEHWIEILIRYLRQNDDAQEYIEIRPAALYGNPRKTNGGPSGLIEGPWNRPGATVGNEYTIQHLFLASADCCLWLTSRQEDRDVSFPAESQEVRYEAALNRPSGGLGRKPVRRHSKNLLIDSALRRIAEARPRSHEEVFRALDGRAPIPHVELFQSAGGWSAGFRRDKAGARAWLSKAWSRLNLPAFPRGPK